MSYTSANVFRCFHCGYKCTTPEAMFDDHLQNGACVVLGP